MNLAPGRYAVTAKLVGLHRLQERERAGQCRLDRAARRHAERRRPGRAESRSRRRRRSSRPSGRRSRPTSTSTSCRTSRRARDPWVVLQTVPGIIVDRVNVGGAESGQQSNYQAKGANPDQNTWNMDGIAITDMGSLGASPTYYDFDMFQEMQVTTGGADPANATPGVQLNFVLRSGTSKWRGSSRYYFENNDLQSDNVSRDLFGEIAQLQPRRRVQGLGRRRRRADHPQPRCSRGAPTARPSPSCSVFSFDAAVDDYLQIARDATTLENISAKVDRRDLAEVARRLHLLPRQQAEVRPRRLRLPSRRDDLQPGRPDRSLQGRVQPDVGTNLFLVGRYAHTKNGFSLEPRGGRDVQSYRDDSQRLSRVVRLGADQPAAGQRRRSKATCSRASTT